MLGRTVSRQSFSIDVAAAVNDEKVLSLCLARSPDIATGDLRLRTYSGFERAGLAYNLALSESDADYLVLAHQDVYLPAGFADALRDQLAQLNSIDPEWAVAGSIGLDTSGALCGKVWSSGLGRIIGTNPEHPTQTICLDELLIVVRKGSEIQFDAQLPGFHMYGLDVVHQGHRLQKSSYILDLPVIHHSRPVITLSGGYSDAYRYMRSKWREQLPLRNLICTVYPTSAWLHWRNLQLRRRHRGRKDRPEPVGDPASIARQIGFELGPE